jgi:chromosome partition protein MukF
VHRYLRDVVRLDPDRALSQRLRDQVAAWPGRPFHLVVGHAPSIRLLRELESRVERAVVARPRVDREAEPAWVDPENMLADIHALVAQALDDGVETLADVTSRVLPALPPAAHYAAAGRVADAVARLARVRGVRERPWAAVLDRLEIEDWIVYGRGRP